MKKANPADIYKENNEINCNTNMNKKMIRLTESDIHRIVKESVNRILRETKGFDTVNKDGPLPINQFHPDWVYYQREQQGPYPEDYEEWFNPEDEDLSQKFEDAHERLHKKHYGKLSPQEIERMAEREVYGESKIGRAIRESVDRVLNEVWDIDDNGIVDYDEFGRAKNRSYADVRGLGRGLASDTKQHLRSIPHRDPRAETNYQYRLDEPEGREHSDDSGKWMRPSDWFVRGADGLDNDEFKDFDKQTSQQPKTDKSFNRALDAADKRPLHRKGSLNRAFDD